MDHYPQASSGGSLGHDLVASLGRPSTASAHPRVGEQSISETFAFTRKDTRMVFQEKKPTPAIPLTEEEQTKLELEAQASEDRWVENFIDRLAGVVRKVRS